MTARFDNLVLPLAHKATAMCTADTADSHQVRSGTVSQLIGSGLRLGDVDSKIDRMPGIRASTTVTRTTITRTTSSALALSANYPDYPPQADFTFEELTKAYFECRKNKRNKTSALAFEQDLERNLSKLYSELQAGSYRPGKSICFVITKPKPREVWAADFRDRIIHHLFYNKVASRFENAFIADSCACIPGRGTLYAGKRLESKIRSATENWSKPCYYLKCDFANFFVAIDKQILFAELSKKIVEPWWLWLASLILFHDPRTDFAFKGHESSIELVPPHKRLISHESGFGLPIGNLSSQFFANVYLNVLDQYVKHQIGAKHYIRYVDDFVILHESAQWLNDALKKITAFSVARLNANLNPKKTILQPTDRGVDFVGHVIKPWVRSIRKRVIKSAINKVNEAGDYEIFASTNSYFGLLTQSSKSHHARSRLARAALHRGQCVNQQFTKVFRKGVT